MTKDINVFMNDEYKQQAANDNFTRIPNIFGLKVTQNKVIHTVLQRNIKNWIKVDALANVTAGETLYLGGATNIEDVIKNMSADYIGATNMTLLDKKGLFGTWMDHSSAASRYIYVRPGNNLSKYFNPEDLNILPRYNFEGEDIEYKFFTFNIPLVLINRQSGIGTGHSCTTLGSDPDDIINHLKKKLKGQKSNYKFLPSFKNWSGDIIQGDSPNKWIIQGTIKRSKFQTEIISCTPYDTYKSYIKKLDKLQEQNKIKSYIDICQPKSDSFHFIIKHQELNKTDTEMLELLKLSQKVSENYTFNDEHNKIITFETREEVFEYWYKVKLEYLKKRKEYLIQALTQDIKILVSKYVFIKSIIDETLIISKRPTGDIIEDLKNTPRIIESDGYGYLLGMTIQSLTEERTLKLVQQIKDKKEILDFTKKATLEEMWLEDLK